VAYHCIMAAQQCRYCGADDGRFCIMQFSRAPQFDVCMHCCGVVGSARPTWYTGRMSKKAAPVMLTTLDPKRPPCGFCPAAVAAALFPEENNTVNVTADTYDVNAPYAGGRPRSEADFAVTGGAGMDPRDL
jgi:hypothetical protein